MAQNGIDDDGIHEIFLLASYGVGYTLSRIKIDPKNITVLDANEKTILEVKREDLAKMTVSELGKRLVEATSKGKEEK